MESERNLIFEVLKEMQEFDCIDLLDSKILFFENKDLLKSQAIRKKANKLFSKSNHDQSIHEEIWKLYTKCIAYAPQYSEDLAFGYANRSALLLHLGKYNDCLMDIDRALCVTNSNALVVKLYCRQIECNVALQNGREKTSLERANEWLSEIEKVEEREKSEKLIEIAKQVIETGVAEPLKKDKEYDVSCDNTAFRTSYNEKYGKHLVADRDIAIGELIYMERFYVATPNTTKFYAYCSHCLAISWCLIPCDYCSFYLYCSEKCKEEAWNKYHDIECDKVKFGKYPENIHESYVQLSLRAFVMGFKETGSIDKLKKLTEEIDNCKDLGKKGFTADGKFSSDSFRSLYSLTCSKSKEKIKLSVPLMLQILVSLAKNTQIFGKDFKYTNSVDLMKNKEAIFVASLLVRLLSISYLNAFDLTSSNWECRKYNLYNCMRELCCSRGLTISLFTSLINHSCDNNVDKCYTNDGRVVYYALKPIAKNSQIFSKYYYNFARSAKCFREKFLPKVFEFRCDCLACKKDWLPVVNGDIERVHTVIGDTCYSVHEKTIKKLQEKNSDPKSRRVSTKEMRAFIQDTLILLTLDRPLYVTEYFLWSLSLMIEYRYFSKLQIPSTCKK